jgi:hypothetical protein
MKTLTIAQPWAELIATGEKRIENRTWSTPHRGPIAIHAGKSLNWLKSAEADAENWHDTYGLAVPKREGLVFGAIIAIADLVDCVPVDRLPEDLRGHRFAEGPICWVLANVRRIEPVPFTGCLGLFDIPEELIPQSRCSG